MCTSVFLRFRLQFPFDYKSVFRYCAGCKSYTNTENRREHMTNMKKHNIAVQMATVLTSPTTATVAPAGSVRISNCKGSTLEVGERSDLIIGSSGTEYTVTSSDLDTVTMEQMLPFWTAASPRRRGRRKHDTHGQHCRRPRSVHLG